jgi:hypothetical protein
MVMGSNWSGLILVAVIALGLAWVWNKGRKKFGSSANGKSLLTGAVVIGVILILLFGASHTPHH